MESFNRQIAADIRKRSAEAVRIGGEQLKRDLRAMTRGPLGERIAKAWRLQTYGDGKSESPAAFVWSNAPDVISGNMRNVTIVPRGGSQFFAIPTDDVPRRRGRGAKARMGPEEVEAHYNQDLILRKGRRPGTLLGFIDRNITIRTGRRRARRQRLVLMFTFVRTLTKRKTIDPDAAFAKARARTKRHLQEG